MDHCDFSRYKFICFCFFFSSVKKLNYNLKDKTNTKIFGTKKNSSTSSVYLKVFIWLKLCNFYCTMKLVLTVWVKIITKNWLDFRQGNRTVIVSRIWRVDEKPNSICHSCACKTRFVIRLNRIKQRMSLLFFMYKL